MKFIASKPKRWIRGVVVAGGADAVAAVTVSTAACFLFCSPQKVQCAFRQYLVKLLNWIGGLVKCVSRVETPCVARSFFFFVSFSLFHYVSASTRNSIHISFPWSERANDMGDAIVNPIAIHVKLLLSFHFSSAMLHQVRLGVVHRRGIGFAPPAKTMPAASTSVARTLFKHIFVCCCFACGVRLPVLVMLPLLALVLMLVSGFCEFNRPDTQQIIVNNVNLCVCITYYR